MISPLVCGNRLSIDDCRIALTILFIKLHSDDNYFRIIHAREWSEWCGDLEKRISVENNYAQFIHWLYVGVLRRRFSHEFDNGSICRLITDASPFPWQWTAARWSEVRSAKCRQPPSEGYTTQVSENWNHEILESRPKW